MSTIRQIEANRLNALKSTGPRSVEGKAVISMNALKTGIDAKSHVIRGESPEALDALTADYYDHWQPATPQVRALVDSLIANEWLLRRFNKTESQLWEIELNFPGGSYQGAPLAMAYRQGADHLARLQRRIDSAERHYERALRSLERLRAQDAKAVSAPAPGPQAVVTELPSNEKPSNPPVGEKLSPQIGFVPQFPSPDLSPSPNPVRSPESASWATSIGAPQENWPARKKLA